MSESVAIVVTRNSSNHDGNSPGERLKAMVSMLLESERPVAKVLFYTEGLSWVLRGSTVLPQLEELEARGVELIVCQDCAEECGLDDELAVGRLESDDHIIEVMWNAEHVVVV